MSRRIQAAFLGLAAVAAVALAGCAPAATHSKLPGHDQAVLIAPRATPVPAPARRASSIVRTPQPNCLIPTTATDSDMSVGNGHVGFLPVTDLVYTLPNGGRIVVTETSDRLQAQYAASRGTLTYVCVNNATTP